MENLRNYTAKNLRLISPQRSTSYHLVNIREGIYTSLHQIVYYRYRIQVCVPLCVHTYVPVQGVCVYEKIKRHSKQEVYEAASQSIQYAF